MAKDGQFLTVAKLAEAWGVPKSALDRRLKEREVRPDLVKASCSYYSLPRLEKLRPNLGI
ncbi:MAG TPA: hypothetical protein VK977_02355 [Actinomycetota bacterium]|nr:hypothetical protein [Actinomycetota bacterium]